MKAFHEKIKELRLENKLTIKDVAKYIGVSEKTIHRMENCETKRIRLSVLYYYTKLFNVTGEYLLGIDKKRK